MTRLRAGAYVRIFAVLTAAAVCCLALTAPRAGAQQPRPGEYEVKAAYLYNFAKFTVWPEVKFAGPEAPVVFGILGEDPFGDTIDRLSSRTINGRPTEVRRVQDTEAARKCQVLFISASERERLGSILRALGGSGTLLVGDMKDFAARGGMIGFVAQEDSIGFEVNMDTVARSGITIHSRLLKMATIVHDRPSRPQE